MSESTSPDQAPAAAELDPERITAEQFRRARAHLGHIAPGLVDFLRMPRQCISVNLPIEMGDGSIQSFAGYRVLHSRVLGPGKGGILAENGDDLDLAAVAAHRTEAGTVVELPGSRSITNADLLALPRDILLPAALGSQIHGGNAHQVRARLIVEGANRPVTAAADDILSAHGILILPDILANAGGVTVSYYEWLQNIEHHSWPLEEINGRLRARIFSATDPVVSRWRAPPGSCPDATLCTDLRTAALVEALDRLAKVTLQRGIWP